MGSSSSRVGGGIAYEHLCPCDGEYFAITEVQWCEVDLPAAGVLRTGRVVAGICTLGLSEVVNGGIKDATHDYIRVKCKCHKCGAVPWFIYGFGPGGKERICGYYNKSSDVKRYFYCNRNVTLGLIERVYERMRSGGYSLVNYNCGMWSRDMYWDLVKAARDVNGIP